MTDKKIKDRQIGIGEINTIRQILMGERFEQLEQELKSLKKDVNKLRGDVDNGLSDLRQTLKQNDKNMKMNLLNKIVDLENRIVKQHDKTITRIKKDKVDQSEKLSKLFITLGKEISVKG